MQPDEVEHQANTDLIKTLRVQRRLIVVVMVLLALVAAGALSGYLYLAGNISNKVANAKDVACGLYLDVGNAQPTAQERPQPNKLGVAIIVDARNAFAGADCPGSLDPPNPTMRMLAERFGIPLPH